MRAVIVDNHWIYFDNISESEEAVLWQEFSVSEPDVYIDPSQLGNWDGIYRKYNRAKQRMARPFLSMLRGVCKKHDLPLVVQDQRPSWEYVISDPDDVGPDFLPGITLDDHQIRSIQRACKIECGIISVPTGGGKGEIICGVCKAIQCPTVIIAEEKVVIDQLKARLELRDIDTEIGLFYAGKRPNGETIVVGSIQSLQIPSNPPKEPKRSRDEPAEQYERRLERWRISLVGYKTRKKNAKYLREYVKKAEMVIVDECVDENAYINTPNGVKTAGSLFRAVKSGVEEFVSVGGKPFRVLDASEKCDETVDIITARGRRLKVSENHPFAVFRDGKRHDVQAKRLLQDELLLVNDGFIPSAGFDDFWYFVGLFIGDGHLLNYRQIKFGVRKDFDDWRSILRTIAVQFSAELSSNINSRGDLIMRLKSRDLVDKVRSLGFEPGRKMGSINPSFDVPSTAATCALLCGLFDAEGSSYPDHVNFDSSDKPLAEFVQIILSSLGIKSSLYVGNKRYYNKHATGWRVSISGSDLDDYWRLIGFRFTRKKREITISRLDGARYINPRDYVKQWLDILPTTKLANILQCHPAKLSPSNRGKISLRTLLRWQQAIIEVAAIKIGNYGEAKRLLGLSDKKVAISNGVSTMTSWNYRKNNDYSLLVSAVNDIQDKLREPVVDVNLDGYAVEPIMNKEKNNGTQRLIDFTVEDAASFEANGFLVHNCDKAVSDPYKKLFRFWFNGRRRYGFSGTPFDSDKPVEGMVMQEHLGSIIAKESRKKLEEIGRIIPCEYVMFAIGPLRGIRDASAYDIAFDEHIVHNKLLHKLIAGVCKKQGENDGTVVLVDREILGHNLVAELNNVGIESRFIYGKTTKRRRDQSLREFERREFNVLIGGKIINRGLDLAGGCENLIIATGGKLQSGFLQQIGRALRHNNRGYSTVYDFFFRCNKYLYNHSKVRLQTMVDNDYKTTIIFPGGSIDGRKLIQRRFQIPPKLFNSRARG